MKRRNGTIQFILTLLISVIFVSGLASAQQTEVTKNLQIIPNKVPSVKKETQNIRPGDVYSGDAAVAGYEETSSFAGPEVRRYQLKGKRGRTYIFSEVEGYLPGQTHGYFRVLDYYGYGREAEYKRDHLIFTSKTPMPACKDPVKPECGAPMRKVGEFVALFMYDSQFAIYNPVGNYGSGELSYLNADVPEQDITDIDGDGHIEIKAFTKLFERREKDKFPSLVSSKILAIYRYFYDKNCGCSRFVKLKGRNFEKIYLEYANEMKEKRNIFAWLAGIESTENPEEIRKAFDEFMKLPSIDDKEKQRTLEILINNGFRGLKINGKNP